MKQPAHIIVGMSGGVDSSVAALLLLRAGYSVSGLFMKNWDEDDGTEYCTAKADLADAQAVCDKLEIELHTANFAAEYWDNVFEHFLAEYAAGRTPNPDVLCNREIKFKQFACYATALGADLIATGHYVRGETDAHGQFRLLKGCDENKDQSYFLQDVPAEALARCLFPLGHLQKSEVRRIAAEAGFENHRKKDSTGICFIGERPFSRFLAGYIEPDPGPSGHPCVRGRGAPEIQSRATASSPPPPHASAAHTLKSSGARRIYLTFRRADRNRSTGRCQERSQEFLCSQRLTRGACEPAGRPTPPRRRDQRPDVAAGLEPPSAATSPDFTGRIWTVAVRSVGR